MVVPLDPKHKPQKGTTMASRGTVDGFRNSMFGVLGFSLWAYCSGLGCRARFRVEDLEFRGLGLIEFVAFGVAGIRGCSFYALWRKACRLGFRCVGLRVFDGENLCVPQVGLDSGWRLGLSLDWALTRDRLDKLTC